MLSCISLSIDAAIAGSADGAEPDEDAPGDAPDDELEDWEDEVVDEQLARMPTAQMITKSRLARIWVTIAHSLRRAIGASTDADQSLAMDDLGGKKAVDTAKRPWVRRGEGGPPSQTRRVSWSTRRRRGGGVAGWLRSG